MIRRIQALTVGIFIEIIIQGSGCTKHRVVVLISDTMRRQLLKDVKEYMELYLWNQQVY
jgi:hypothetical protein